MKGFGIVYCCYAGVLFSSRISPLLPTLMELTLIIVDDVLRYAVGLLGKVICLTVAVPSHHIAEKVPRTDVAYNVFDNIHVALPRVRVCPDVLWQ